jgi:hypothetical protein
LAVGWYHYDVNGKRQKLDKGASDRHVFTQDHGLVIIGVSEKDAGRSVKPAGSKSEYPTHSYS